MIFAFGNRFLIKRRCAHIPWSGKISVLLVIVYEEDCGAIHAHWAIWQYHWTQRLLIVKSWYLKGVTLIFIISRIDLRWN